MIIRPDIPVYHSSYMEIIRPDLNRCRQGKDFGRGFYVTTNRDQAVRFTKTSVRKAISDGIIPADMKYGYVNEYTLNLADDLKQYEFTDADKRWLHCVVAHRKSGTFPGESDKWKQYDIIAGKIANDNTNLVITAYMEGAYGVPGSERADDIAISFLEPENLRDQICFRSVRAIDTLVFVKSEKIQL